MSIDCGLPKGAEYRDAGNTGLTYVSDAGYVETGEIAEISPMYATENLRRPYRNLRSFPEGGRNCYRLPVNKGGKYLVRAGFMYGNYDGKSSVPTFDLYLGAEKWSSIDRLNRANDVWWDEAVTVATQEIIWVCLVNTGLGTPLISYLELRPLTTSLYPAADATQFLVLWDRYDPGAPKDTYLRQVIPELKINLNFRVRLPYYKYLLLIIKIRNSILTCD